MNQLSQTLAKLGDLTWLDVLKTALLIFFGLLLIKVLLRAIRRVLSRTSLDVSVQKNLTAIIKALALFLLAVLCLGQIGVSAAPLITVLGVFGLAVSLAVQDGLSNFVGGITVATVKPFITGDYIDVCGVSGTVTNIGLTHTTLETTDHRRIHIPNGSIAKDKVVNYSQEPVRRIELTIPVSLKTSAEEGKTLIRGAVLSCDKVLREPEPFVRVSNLTSSCMEYFVSAAVSRENYLQTRSALFEAIKTVLDEHGISMFPTTKVELQKSEDK